MEKDNQNTDELDRRLQISRILGIAEQRLSTEVEATQDEPQHQKYNGSQPRPTNQVAKHRIFIYNITL